MPKKKGNDNKGSKKDSKNNKEINNVKEEINEEPKVIKKVQIIDLDSNSRPYAVMINNIATVWGYQSGLQDAYLVYEIIVEGGYTRLMAVYKDKTLDRIGSVRSSRHYFLDYALENDAIYVHFGWSPQAEADMQTWGVNNINFIPRGFIGSSAIKVFAIICFSFKFSLKYSQNVLLSFFIASSYSISSGHVSK